MLHCINSLRAQPILKKWFAAELVKRTDGISIMFLYERGLLRREHLKYVKSDARDPLRKLLCAKLTDLSRKRVSSDTDTRTTMTQKRALLRKLRGKKASPVDLMAAADIFLAKQEEIYRFRNINFLVSGQLRFGPIKAEPLNFGASIDGRDMWFNVAGNFVELPLSLLRIDAGNDGTAHESSPDVVKWKDEDGCMDVSLQVASDSITVMPPNEEVNFRVKSSCNIKAGDELYRLDCCLGEWEVQLREAHHIAAALRWQEWTSLTAYFTGQRVRFLRSE